MTSLDVIADTIEAFPDVLAALLGPIDSDVLRGRPAPGEWCPLEVIGHLIVVDGPAFRHRIAAIVAGTKHIEAFDPLLERWGRDFQAADLSDLLAELRAERATSSSFLRSLDPLVLRRAAVLEGRGRFTAGDFVHEWPFHDQDHLQQILAATKCSYLYSMTESMRDALAS